MVKEKVNAKHQKFIGLLKELFQLNQPAVACGIGGVADCVSGGAAVLMMQAADVREGDDRSLVW